MCTLRYSRQVFSPAKVIFAGVGVLLSVRIITPSCDQFNTYCLQAAKDVQAPQDTRRHFRAYRNPFPTPRKLLRRAADVPSLRNCCQNTAQRVYSYVYDAFSSLFCHRRDVSITSMDVGWYHLKVSRCVLVELTCIYSVYDAFNCYHTFCAPIISVVLWKICALRQPPSPSAW